MRMSFDKCIHLANQCLNQGENISITMKKFSHAFCRKPILLEASTVLTLS